MAGLADILETTQLQKVADGFVFTEGPLWHPDDFWYFVDIRQNLLYRMVLGQQPTVVRQTIGGNGTTFDLQGRLINCEGDGRMVTRLGPAAKMPFGIHPHMLRHSTGFKLANQGVDTRSLQHYLGHKNIQHTVRYSELSPERFRDFWRD